MVDDCKRATASHKAHFFSLPSRPRAYMAYREEARDARRSASPCIYRRLDALPRRLFRPNGMAMIRWEFDRPPLVVQLECQFKAGFGARAARWSRWAGAVATRRTCTSRRTHLIGHCRTLPGLALSQANSLSATQAAD